MRWLIIFALTIGLASHAARGGEAVKIDSGSGVLYGTLEIPEGDGPFPVALIIAGSGPTDRNGNAFMMGLVSNHQKLLADALAERGIASLRFDKRAIGQSAAAGLDERVLRFSTYVDDAVLWGKMLAEDPRFSRLFVIGHSEGSLIGMMAARQLDAAGFVSIAGAGTGAADVLREQLAKIPDEKLRQRAFAINDQLEKGQTVDDVPGELFTLYRSSVQPYVISWFQIDPVEELKKLDCPVLVIDGTTDIQVGPKHAPLLVRAREGVSHVRIEGMNHILKLVPDDPMQQTASYSNPALPVAEELVSSVSKFIKESGNDESR